jgi:hypothetical protein
MRLNAYTAAPDSGVNKWSICQLSLFESSKRNSGHLALANQFVHHRRFECIKINVMTEPCAKPPEASKCLGGKHHPPVLKPPSHRVKRWFRKPGKATSFCTNHMPCKGRQTTPDALLKTHFSTGAPDKVPILAA